MDTIKQAAADLGRVTAAINTVIKGKQEVVRSVLEAVVAGGHVLMEDIPGVGKTTLATTLARVLELSYHRVQFTPDVLPSDILGFSMYDESTHTFNFREGSIYCNLFLADEINRTSPKTQSALLEAMEERQATVEGVTRSLPRPFVVIATENPAGSSGTQLLPESQLDRFMIRVSMGYPSHADTLAIIKDEVWLRAADLAPVISQTELLKVQELARSIHVHESIYDYIVTLVEATRSHELFTQGASPRACIALLAMSRASAIIDGRDFVDAKDVVRVADPVLGHRIRLSGEARTRGMGTCEAISRLIHDIPGPRMS